MNVVVAVLAIAFVVAANAYPFYVLALWIRTVERGPSFETKWECVESELAARRAQLEAEAAQARADHTARMAQIEAESAQARADHTARMAKMRADHDARMARLRAGAPRYATHLTTCITPTAAVVARRARSQRRAERIRQATIPGEQPTTAEILALRQGTCAYCGGDASHADHIRPVSRGGWHHLDNMVSACEECNSNSKHSKLLVEWMRARPDLVLQGCERNENVLREYVYEMRHATVLKFEYQASSDFVREACERHGFPELAVTQRTVEYALSASRPYVELESLPLPPIDSELTQPAIDDGAARQWTRIGERKAAKRRELVSA